jgi:hypothetical protein
VSRYIFALVTDLYDGLIFREVEGRNMTEPFNLGSARPVQAYIIPPAEKGLPFVLRVVDLDQIELARAYMVENTTQLFPKIGLLIHITELPS